MISDDRMLHSLRVAQKLQKAAEEMPNIYGAFADEMFLLGLLHDIGYEFTADAEQHAQVGGEFLRRQGFKLWKEVYYHGNPRCRFHSAELDLLNRADMTVDHCGKEVTIEERLADIANRHGKDSAQYRTAVEMAAKLSSSVTKM